MNALRLTVYIPGNKLYIAPDVTFSDLAAKLRNVELGSGQHDILIYSDGSVGVDGELIYRPKPLNIAKAG